MKKSLNFIVLFLFLFINAKSQFSIGEKVSSAVNYINVGDKYNVTESFSDGGFVISKEITTSDFSVNFISKSGYKGGSPDYNNGSFYFTCDSILFKFKNRIKYDEIVNQLNSSWNNLGNGKWSYNNKDKKIKSIAEIISNDGQNSIAINSVYYGRRNK